MHDAQFDDTHACQTPFDEAAQAIGTGAAFTGQWAPGGALLAYGVHLTGLAYCDPQAGDPQAASAQAKLGYDPTNEAVPSFTPPPANEPNSFHYPDLSCPASDASPLRGSDQSPGFDYGVRDAFHSGGGFDYSADAAHASCDCGSGDGSASASSADTGSVGQ